MIRMGNYIRFTTQNSEYLFTWFPGEEQGTLTGLRGTFLGDVAELPVEPFRDLAWPDEHISIPGLFSSTTIVEVTRKEHGYSKAHTFPL